MYQISYQERVTRDYVDVCLIVSCVSVAGMALAPGLASGDWLRYCLLAWGLATIHWQGVALAHGLASALAVGPHIGLGQLLLR